MESFPKLQRFARDHAPPALARGGKLALASYRANKHLREARRGFAEHGHRYPHPILFIAGMPKAGTTWVEKMLASLPGMSPLALAATAPYELLTGGSHHYPLPVDTFEHLRGALGVLKMHIPGSPRNARILRKAAVPHLVLSRDLRDVAVSHHYYVQRTPWHPEHARYVGRTVQEGLAVFAERELIDFVWWLQSWRSQAEHPLCHVLAYENLREDPVSHMKAVAKHFELPLDDADIVEMVEAHSFQKLSGGRKQGSDDGKSFFRKGVSGDWRNHFTPQLDALYTGICGELDAEMGWER